MPRIFQLTKMPRGDYRMILCDDGDDSPRRNFKHLLGAEFYDTTVLTQTSVMRPGVTPKDFMQHVREQNPGSDWVELQPRVWRWAALKGA